MTLRVIYLVLVLCIIEGVQCYLSSKNFSMDNAQQCQARTSSVTWLEGRFQNAHVTAWEKGFPQTPLHKGCTMTFHSYHSSYGLKYYFHGGGYISDCRVTINVYNSLYTNGVPMVGENYHSLEHCINENILKSF